MTNQHILITGGAGFIGINAAEYFLSQHNHVTILDNFSRKGSKKNIEWLKTKKYKYLQIVEYDLRKPSRTLNHVVQKANHILHLAGQVAVTSSIENPREDFECNVLSTLNVLEAIRKTNHNPPILYASTNKVYGSLEALPIVEQKTRYAWKHLPYGISEEQCLDFHSPYGCSKGAADQYVHDYSRIYGLRTIVFRQSCIYGPHQFGVEDQGWLAWFMFAALHKKHITIYGNGKQVRDLLYIDDLVSAYDQAFAHIKKTAGQVYNIGGGAQNTLSIWLECKPLLEKLFHRSIESSFAPERPGDQNIFFTDIRKAHKQFCWKPTVKIEKGIKLLYEWITFQKEHI